MAKLGKNAETPTCLFLSHSSSFAFFPSNLIPSASIPQPENRQTLQGPSTLNAWIPRASRAKVPRHRGCCICDGFWTAPPNPPCPRGVSLGCCSALGPWLCCAPIPAAWGRAGAGTSLQPGSGRCASGARRPPRCTPLGSSPLGLPPIGSLCSFLWQHTLRRNGLDDLVVSFNVSLCLFCLLIFQYRHIGNEI